jgi:hypothetical protein
MEWAYIEIPNLCFPAAAAYGKRFKCLSKSNLLKFRDGELKLSAASLILASSARISVVYS